MVLPPTIHILFLNTAYHAVCLPSQSLALSNFRSRCVFGFTSVHAFPLRELHTSLLQTRGKYFLSLGFHPPNSHIRPLNVSAPAPSRAAKAVFVVTFATDTPLHQPKVAA